MRVERVYDWKKGAGLVEVDPVPLDLSIKPGGATRIGHLSDTHLGKGDGQERRQQLKDWLQLFSGLDVEVIVHSGDLVEDSDDHQEVQWALDLLDAVDIPVLGVPGNHDVAEPGEQNRLTRQWGPFPRAEKVGALQFWLVDSMRCPPAEDRSPREKESARISGFYSRGALGAEQLAELKAKMTHLSGVQILVIHHHLRQPVPAKPFYEENSDLMAPLEDADQLLEVARQAGVRLVLHGHRHQYVIPFMPFEDLVILNGGSSTRDGWPKRARVIDMGQKGEALRIWELARFSR